MTEAVIWDMGGVLYRYFTELVLDVGRARGWPVERLPLGPTGPAPDPHYQRLTSGEIDEPDYLARLVAALEAEGIAFDPPRQLDWSGELRPEVWEAIEAIHHAGYRQALLTNDATKWLGERWWETWEPARWFEEMIDVVTLPTRKPDPGPYLACAEALDLPPDRCLFVDDLPVNCRGAEAVGMSSHRFDVADPAGSITRLRKRLGVS